MATDKAVKSVGCRTRTAWTASHCNRTSYRLLARGVQRSLPDATGVSVAAFIGTLIGTRTNQPTSDTREHMLDKLPDCVEEGSLNATEFSVTSPTTCRCLGELAD